MQLNPITFGDTLKGLENRASHASAFRLGFLRTGWICCLANSLNTTLGPTSWGGWGERREKRELRLSCSWLETILEISLSLSFSLSISVSLSVCLSIFLTFSCYWCNLCAHLSSSVLELLSGLTFYRFCVCCQNPYEFICATAMLWPENSDSLILSIPSSVKNLKPWKEGCKMCAPFMFEQSIVSYPLYFEELSFYINYHLLQNSDCLKRVERYSDLQV